MQVRLFDRIHNAGIRRTVRKEHRRLSQSEQHASLALFQRFGLDLGADWPWGRADAPQCRCRFRNADAAAGCRASHTAASRKRHAGPGAESAPSRALMAAGCFTAVIFLQPAGAYGSGLVRATGRTAGDRRVHATSSRRRLTGDGRRPAGARYPGATAFCVRESSRIGIPRLIASSHP